jgi:hypothetical protein
MSVILRMPKQQIVIAAEEVDKLKSISRFIGDALEFSDQGDEDKEFPIAIQDEFDEENIADAIAYLQKTNYQPTIYKKVPQGDLNTELATDIEKQLAIKYKSRSEIRRLHSAAKYLQIRPLKTFALILIGVTYWVNPNEHDSLEKVKATHGITSHYNIDVEKDIKQKYSHLAGHSG